MTRFAQIAVLVLTSPPYLFFLEIEMIKFFADTTSTISPAEAKQLGVYYLPQIIVFGDKAYRDDNEITSAEFLSRLKSSSSLPKTAAPPPALYTPMFKEL